MTQQTEQPLVGIGLGRNAGITNEEGGVYDGGYAPLTPEAKVFASPLQPRLLEPIPTEKSEPQGLFPATTTNQVLAERPATTMEEEIPNKEQSMKQQENDLRTIKLDEEDRMEVEEVQPPVLSTEKCSNKHCHSSEMPLRIKSRIDGRSLCLCRACSNLYHSQKFCQVCQQIYSTQQLDDGEQWVECEGEGCARWNHTQCERKRNRFGGRGRYLCTECQKRNRRKRPQLYQTLEMGRQQPQRKPQQHFYQHQLHAPASKRFKIFEVRKEPFHYLQPFLSTYSKEGYRLALGEEPINNDLQSIRHRLAENSQREKRMNDGQNRSKKKR